MKTILRIFHSFPVWDTIFVVGVCLVGWGLLRWSLEIALVYSGLVLVLAACVLGGGSKPNDR